MLSSGCYLNSLVLYSTSGEGSFPLSAACQSVLTHLRQGPLLFLCAQQPARLRTKGSNLMITGWLAGVGSTQRALYCLLCHLFQQLKSHNLHCFSSPRRPLGGKMSRQVWLHFKAVWKDIYCDVIIFVTLTSALRRF